MTTINSQVGDALMVYGIFRYLDSTLGRNWRIYDSPGATSIDQITAGTYLGQTPVANSSYSPHADGYYYTEQNIVIPATANGTANWLIIYCRGYPAYGYPTATPIAATDTAGAITVPTTTATDGQDFIIPPFKIMFAPRTTTG